MFELKKYKVIKAFNGYRVGTTIAFNGADAKRYEAYIVSQEKPLVKAILETPVQEVAQVVKKTIRCGRKAKK